MIQANEAVVWVNDGTREVMVKSHSWGCPAGSGWCDPIGAAYSEWQDGTDADAKRVRLMLETAIDLTMQGYSMQTVLRAFAEVPQFRALGGQSSPMCRALTQALIGECLEPNTMSFEELLVAYQPADRVSSVL